MIKIRKCSNGFIMNIDGEESIYNGNLEGLRDLLSIIVDELGMSGSRYDAERLYLVLAPGDKHEDFNNEHSNVIYGKYEDNDIMDLQFESMEKLEDD